MLEPFIIRKIREEEERRRRERQQQPEIPLYYEPPRDPRPRIEKEDDSGGTVIEIDL